MRISGLASGMDTDTMVQSMMKAERLKLTRFEQNKQIALWRQESYNTINKMFANFILNTKKDIGLKTTTSKGISFDKSYTSLDYVKKATSSNELAATVSSTSKAVNGSFDLEVIKLAVAARGGTYAAKIEQESFDGPLTFQVNGETIDVGEAGKKVNMDQIVNAINARKNDTGVIASYNKNGRTLIMETIDKGAGNKVDFTGIFVGQSVEGTDGEDAIIKFNGIQLEYSTNNFDLNGVNIEAKATGVTTINVSTNVEGIMEKVEKLIKDYNDLIDVASLLLNEKKYSSYKPLSTEERNGMKENDVKLWDEKAKSGLLNSDETINRTLQTMRNNLYKELDNHTGSFKHITQIGISTEAYARGAAGGKLQIDTEKLRKAIEEDPDGVMELLFKEPAALGGKPTSPIKPAEGEDMTEYEDALKKYKEDLRDYEANDKAYRNNNSGIFTRIYDDLIDGMKSIIEKSGTGSDSDLYRNVKSNILIDFVTTKSSISDIDKSITEMNRQMDNLNILFAKKEDSYYAKFTQMEKYMQQMNSQSGWLSQQFMR